MLSFAEHKLWMTLRLATLPFSIIAVFVAFFPAPMRAQSPGPREYLHIPVNLTIAYIDDTGTASQYCGDRRSALAQQPVGQHNCCADRLGVIPTPGTVRRCVTDCALTAKSRSRELEARQKPGDSTTRPLPSTRISSDFRRSATIRLASGSQRHS